jgi:anti-sigma regulatory factor (Ser/Thr protein kinase)
VSELTIIAPSESVNICVVRCAVETYACRHGFSREEADQIGLAVNEAMANVIKHGYGGECDQRIHVTFSLIDSSSGAAKGLKVVIRDFGRQVDPECIRSRNLDDVRPGGLGVHLIRSVMDEVGYRQHDEGGMELTMIKYPTMA